MIIFANIYFLIFIPFVVVAFLRKRKTSSLKFSSVALMKKTSKKVKLKHKIGSYLIIISLLLFIVALARPRIELAEAPIVNEGIDIALVLDVSGSMESVDFTPNRLEVARDTIENFIKQRYGDRLGFIVFAGSAYTKIPLTLDYDILRQSLSNVSVESVKEEGTAIGMAISVGVNRLKKSEADSKVMILVTDGDNNAGAINPETATKLARDLGIKIYSIGVGTDKTILPVEIFGQTRYQEYEGGLNEELLQNIAATTNGKYYRAKDSESLTTIFNEIDELEKTDFEQKHYKQYKELAYNFMKIALVFLVIGVFLDRYYFLQIP